MQQYFDERFVEMASTLCTAVSSPFSLKYLEKVRQRDWSWIQTAKVNPHSYTHSWAYDLDALVANLFRKLESNDASTSARLERECVESFITLERGCCETNRRFIEFSHYTPEWSDRRLLNRLERARAIIRKILGRVPEDLDGRFGPGTTYTDRGKLATIPDKITNFGSSTADAEIFSLLHRENVLFDAKRRPSTKPLEIVRGNRFTTVPKDSCKRRGICIEPSWNLFLQLGVGAHIRSRLDLYGLSIKEGQTRHVDLAQKALKRNLITIDLSSASDTISNELVRWLLPPDWYALLDSLRSRFTEIDGRWFRLEKFSSMGNGFTFELETLIFLSICFAADDTPEGAEISIHGDDIIVDKRLQTVVLELLTFCGFTTNVRKTFYEGVFRESCGGDFFNGTWVTPVYVKSYPSSVPEYYVLYNQLHTWSRLRGLLDDPENDVLAALRRIVLSWIPIRERFYGPHFLGDAVLHSETYRISIKADSPGVETVRGIKPKLPRLSWKYFEPSVVLACALYGLPSSHVSVRGEPVGYSRRNYAIRGVVQN